MKASEFRDNADSFTKAYVEAALWSSTLPLFGTCPCCGEEKKVLDRLPEDEFEQVPMCSDEGCGVREMSSEPPADANYSIEEIAETTLDRIVADCTKFQADHAEILSDIECARNSGEYTTDEQAGHDFWLTRNGHGAGFWDGDWPEPQATTLDKASKAFGEFSLYVGDDGLIYA